jgi:hypothetical protein
MTPEERAKVVDQLTELRREVGATVTRLQTLIAAHEQHEARRRARLRRVSFGLLGRE